MRSVPLICAASLLSASAWAETETGTVAGLGPPTTPATQTASRSATVDVVPEGAASQPADGVSPSIADSKPRPEDNFAEPTDTVHSVLRGLDATGNPTYPPNKEEVPAASQGPVDRSPPNYDQRADAPPTAGDILIWVPRVAFFPLYFALEYLLRRPLVWLVTRAEEHYVFKRIERFMSFRDGKSIVFPTFLADFGLRPAAGLTNTNRDLFFDGNTLSLSATYGGSDFIRFGVRNDTVALVDDSGLVTAQGEFVIRPDQPYYGTGPFTRTTEGDDGIGGRYNYQVRRAQAGLSMRALLSDLDWVRFGANFKDIAFSDDGVTRGLNADRRNFENFRNETSRDVCARTQAQQDQQNIPRCQSRGIFFPDGYESEFGEGTGPGGYQIIESFVDFKIDTRSADVEFEGGTGLLFEGFGSFGFDPTESSTNFVRWGGDAGAFWDTTGRGHVLALRVYGEFIEDTGSSETPVPFTELPALGGQDTMRGFLDRRFVGDSVFMTTVSYRYPIWAILDAELFAEVGNAFDGHYQAFSFERMHLSTGLSIRTRLARDTGLQILAAVGTRRFEETETDNFEIDSVRFSFGVYQGF